MASNCLAPSPVAPQNLASSASQRPPQCTEHWSLKLGAEIQRGTNCDGREPHERKSSEASVSPWLETSGGGVTSESAGVGLVGGGAGDGGGVVRGRSIRSRPPVTLPSIRHVLLDAGGWVGRSPYNFTGPARSSINRIWAEKGAQRSNSDIFRCAGSLLLATEPTVGVPTRSA